MAKYVELDIIAPDRKMGTVVVEFKLGHEFATFVRPNIPIDCCFGWMQGARVSWESIERDVEAYLKPDLLLKARISSTWQTDSKGRRN